MKILPKLFISIGNKEIIIITGVTNDQNSFDLLEKLILPTDGISQNKISDLEKYHPKQKTIILNKKVSFFYLHSFSGSIRQIADVKRCYFQLLTLGKEN